MFASLCCELTVLDTNGHIVQHHAMLVIGLLLVQQVIHKRLVLPLASIAFLTVAVHSLRHCFSDYASATPFAVLEVITTVASLMGLLRVWYSQPDQ